MIYKAATRRRDAARLLRRVAAIDQQTPFQGRWPWLNYFAPLVLMTISGLPDRVLRFSTPLRRI